MDFTTSDNSAGIHNILKSKYSLATHYYSSFQNDLDNVMNDGCDHVERYASSVFGRKVRVSNIIQDIFQFIHLFKGWKLHRNVKKAMKARRISWELCPWCKVNHALLVARSILTQHSILGWLDEDMDANQYTMFSFTICSSIPRKTWPFNGLLLYNPYTLPIALNDHLPHFQS